MASTSKPAPDQSKISATTCKTCGSGESCAHHSVGDKGGIWAFAVIALLFLSSGLFFGAGGIYSAHQDHKLVSNGVHSVGQVTEVDFQSGRRNKMYTVITVPFTAEDGKQYYAEGTERYRDESHGSREERTEELLDSKQTVFYDPEDPNKSVLEGKERGYFVPIALLTLLGGMGAFGYLVVLFALNGKRQSRKNSKPMTGSR